MRIRVVADSEPSAVEVHEVADLVYDMQASDFSIPGGYVRVRLINAPLPTRIEFDTGGPILWFNSTDEADRFSASLRDARNTASRLGMTMLD